MHSWTTVICSGAQVGATESASVWYDDLLKFGVSKEDRNENMKNLGRSLLDELENLFWSYLAHQLEVSDGLLQVLVTTPSNNTESVPRSSIPKTWSSLSWSGDQGVVKVAQGVQLRNDLQCIAGLRDNWENRTTRDLDTIDDFTLKIDNAIVELTKQPTTTTPMHTSALFLSEKKRKLPPFFFFIKRKTHIPTSLLVLSHIFPQK